VAEDSEALWKVFPNQPLNHLCAPAHLKPVLVAPAIDMVDSQKLNLRFTAASALPTVVIYDSEALSPLVLTLILGVYAWILFFPSHHAPCLSFSAGGAMFMPGVSSPSALCTSASRELCPFLGVINAHCLVAFIAAFTLARNRPLAASVAKSIAETGHC
jgi:hypothetical protein